jgi:hypothetical protein
LDEVDQHLHHIPSVEMREAKQPLSFDRLTTGVGIASVAGRLIGWALLIALDDFGSCIGGGVHDASALFFGQASSAAAGSDVPICVGVDQSAALFRRESSGATAFRQRMVIAKQSVVDAAALLRCEARVQAALGKIMVITVVKGVVNASAFLLCKTCIQAAAHEMIRDTGNEQALIDDDAPGISEAVDANQFINGAACAGGDV